MIEKKKKSSEHMNRWVFLALWIAAHIIAWSGTNWLINASNPPDEPKWLFILAVVTLLGLIPGILLSFPQKWLLKRGLGLDVAWWRRASIAAWGMGGLALVGLFFMVTIQFELPTPIIILTWFSPLILTQYALIRRYIPRASLFALANLASVIVFGQFVGLNGDAEILRFLFAGGLQGAVTGLTLLWLYGMAQQDKSKYVQSQENVATERLRDSVDHADYQAEDGTQSASTISL